MMALIDTESLRAAWAELPGWAQLSLPVVAVAAALCFWAWRRSAARAARLAAAAALGDERQRIAARDLAAAVGQADSLAAALDEARRDLAQQVAESARAGEAEARLEQQAAGLRQELAQALAAAEAERNARAELQAEHRALVADRDEKLASSRREVEALKALREELTRQFEAIAAATLRRTGADFEKAHTEQLTALLAPFREQVGSFEKQLRDVHGAADRERARLGEQIRLLTQKTDAIGAEALNLTRALKGDKQLQGAWGEMILERLLEDSGLIEGTHYLRQQSRSAEDGSRFRPDVIVLLPQERCLVIDSKVSLVAYEAGCAATDSDNRAQHMKDHAAALRRHIDLLSAKGYQTLAEGSIDYVLMFVPIEGAFSEAARVAPDLAAYAAERRVGLVTPTTLLLALKTVDHIWTVEKRERNAEAIAERAGLLYDKFAGFIDDLDKVGRALDQAVRAKADAMGKLSQGPGNLLRQAELLSELGARTRKRISQPHDDAAALPTPDAAE